MKKTPLKPKPRKCKHCGKPVYGLAKFCTRKCEKASGIAGRKKARGKKETPYRNKLDAQARKKCKSVGRCQAEGYGIPYPPDLQWGDKTIMQSLPCAGRLEWCHLKTRGRKATRHLEENCVCMCSAHHRHFTNHPDLFYRFIEENWPGRWDFLNKVLIENPKPESYRDKVERDRFNTMPDPQVMKWDAEYEAMRARDKVERQNKE